MDKVNKFGELEIDYFEKEKVILTFKILFDNLTTGLFKPIVLDTYT